MLENDPILRALEESRFEMPPIAELVVLLNDPDQSLEEVGRVCYQLQWVAGWRDEPEALDALLVFASDAAIPLERRRLAIWPIVLREDRRIVPVLTELLEDKTLSVDFRHQVIDALSDLGDGRAVPALIAVLRESNLSRKLQGAIIRALGNIGDPGALPALLEQLRDGRRKVRKATISAIGDLHDASGTSALVPILVNESLRSDERISAAWSLGEIGGHEAVQSLLRVLGRNDEEVRLASIEALGRMSAEEAVPVLWGIATDSAELAESRGAALTALLSIGLPPSASEGDRSLDAETRSAWMKYAPLLLKLLHHDNAVLRESSAAFLGELRSIEAVDELISMLRDESEDVRTAAALALCEIGDKRAVEPLLEIVRDHSLSRNTRSYSLIALKAFADASLVEPLIAELRMPPEHDGADCHIVMMLGEIGDKRAVEPLIRLITSPEIKEANDVCYYAATALGKLGDRRAFEPLARLLIYNDREVRCYTAEALGLLGDPSALPYLEWLMQYGMEWIYELGYIKDIAGEAIERIKAANP